MKKIIKASAGTGKTYSLALEYIKELIMGTDFRKIYVMTFTKKATSEIRERVLSFLEEIANETETGKEIIKNINGIDNNSILELDKMKKIYKDVIFNKDKIKIYTIDSFVKSIFDRLIAEKRHIYTYSIDNDTNKEILENVLARLISDKNHLEKVKAFLMKERRRNLEEYEALIDQLIKNRWKFEFIGKNRIERKKYMNIDILSETERMLINSYEVIALTELDREEMLKDPFLTYINLENETEKTLFIRKNLREFFKVSSDIIWNGNKTRGNKYKEAVENFKDEYREYKKTLAKYIFNEEIIEYEKDYFEIANIVFGIYDNIRFSEKSFNNSDRIIYTYRLLFENNKYIENNKVTDEFFEFFGNEVETIFIDEFQDTSVLQWRVLRAIVEGSKNSVIVGDAKQSIYGWRDGEKRLFQNLENILDGDVEVNSLSKTYRTKENVMLFLNILFGNISESWEYEHVEYNSQDGFLELKVYNNSNSEEDVKETIINDIITLLKEKNSYKNTAVIARSNKELSNMAIYLENHQIPFILESNKTLAEYEETAAVFYLIHFFVFKDYISLIKFLRSDFVDINADDLKYILENKRKVEDYLGNREIEIECLKEILDKIKILDKLNYPEKIKYLFENFNIIKKDKSNIVYKNLLYLYNLMLKFESLEEFLEKTEENKELIAIQGLNEANAVILTTIHKSKGLEYDTVYYLIDSSSKKGNDGTSLEFLVELEDSFTNVKDYIIFNGKNKAVLELLDEHKNIIKNNEAKKEDENINNLYVALTRAKSNLYIFYYTGIKSFRDDNLEKALKKAVDQELEMLLETSYSNGVLGEEEFLEERLENEEVNIKKYFIDTKIYDKMIKNIKSLDIENTRKEGLAIHYYFENIKYAEKEEIFFARSQVFQKYGNMLGREKLEEIFLRADRFIDNNKILFDKNWEIFNEYEIIEEETSEVYRIDKLLINKESKEVIILDFKSGGIHNDDQIFKYENLLKKRLEGYKIKGEFIKL